MPRLQRSVSRIPADDIARIDRLAAEATAKAGKVVSRASVLRAIVTRGLVEAESSADFTSTMGDAIVARGVKRRVPRG